MSVSKELLEKRGCNWCQKRLDKTCRLKTYNAWTERELTKIWKVGDIYYYIGNTCEGFINHDAKVHVVFT